MQEINYTVFDKVSGLPVNPFIDKWIRSMAEARNESLSEAFKRAKTSINKIGVQYFIQGDNLELTAMSKMLISKCQGEYFNDYEKALKHLESLKKLKQQGNK